MVTPAMPCPNCLSLWRTEIELLARSAARNTPVSYRRALVRMECVAHSMTRVAEKAIRTLALRCARVHSEPHVRP